TLSGTHNSCYNAIFGAYPSFYLNLCIIINAYFDGLPKHLISFQYPYGILGRIGGLVFDESIRWCNLPWFDGEFQGTDRNCKYVASFFCVDRYGSGHTWF